MRNKEESAKVTRKNQTQGFSNSGCACCADPLDRELSRRRFLPLAGAGLMAGLFMPRSSLAKDICKTRKSYKAMVLSCIDPRMQKPVTQYLANKKDGTDKNLVCNYSQVNIAGAAVGAVALRFEKWHQTFWGNLNISLAEHRISKVIVINHRRCAAAKEAYGPFEYGSADEVQIHRVVLANFRQQAINCVFRRFRPPIPTQSDQ